MHRRALLHDRPSGHRLELGRPNTVPKSTDTAETAGRATQSYLAHRGAPTIQDFKNWRTEFLRRQAEYEPAAWWHFFQYCFRVTVSGGNDLALWMTESNLEGKYTEDEKIPIVMFIHGGGYSGLSWATLVNEMCYSFYGKFVALDLRGHGESFSTHSGLSLETFVGDILEVLKWMGTDDRVDFKGRKLILVGHSLGGSLAVNVANELETVQIENVPRPSAVVVLDVVEGTSLNAIRSGQMERFLDSRPQSFATLKDAIKWGYKHSPTRCIESVRISMLGQLKVSGTACDTELISRENDMVSYNNMTRKVWNLSPPVAPPSAMDFPVIKTLDKPLTWRLDLKTTAPYWQGWFEGLSNRFLSVPCPKLLLLAGTDRLDKNLMIGQMQGKFQMNVFPNAGHAIHEDLPEKTCECITGFLSRHKLVVLKHPSKIFPPGC